MGKRLNNRWLEFAQPLWSKRRIILTALGASSFVIALRFGGLLQSFEWSLLDQYFRLRPQHAPDSRVLIVEINEADLRYAERWPIPDDTMAALLRRLGELQPRVIGLDIYRDLPVEPGHEEIKAVFREVPNIIGIERIQDQQNSGVLGPPGLVATKQVGFNNLFIDPDGTVRRMLLYWRTEDGVTHRSFALKLVQGYLASEDVSLRPVEGDRDALRLGQATLRRFGPNDGGYVRADNGGYQLLANFQNPRQGFERVSMTAVLKGEVKPEQVRDRVVLIGSTAISIRDFFYTPYSGGDRNSAKPVAGVELHANFVSQLLSAALQGRPLMRVIPDWLEYLWIFAWACLGSSLCWQFRKPWQSAGTILLAMLLLTGTGFVLFLVGWWIPVVPTGLALMGSAAGITSYLAHLEEELKRSKEFLQGVINTIPDPIFVKDQSHRWIVLNEAFSRFLGHPLSLLLERSDYEFFPPDEAAVFQAQDDWVFSCGKEQETEEKFTDVQGVTHQIATKRSLHRDAAGNVFLVGVIRDITERKRMEEELKQTAAELVRSNAELKTSENHLRYLAHHDVLTGLPNRQLFVERLEQALDWARNNHQLVALLYLDLDGFKEINDTEGHDAGDLVLKTVARRLTRCLRGSDTVARLGGDEFTVILPAIPERQIAARVADKILSTLSEPLTVNEKAVVVTTSIGISTFPSNAEDIEVLIKHADIAMYEAKEIGKNCYKFSEAVRAVENLS